MNSNVPSPSNALWLAKRLEEDIRTRALREGEPYLTTAEAGSQLGVSKATAYRAMKLLVERRVLVSHPGRGTFVGPKAGSAAGRPPKCIHVLLTNDYFQSSAPSTYGWLAGLSTVVPGHGIQFDFLPPHDAETNANQLLDHGLGQGTIAGVIVLGCPRAVQECVMKRGVPAVVLGTDYSSTRQLPSVDADQLECGRLAADYLLARGHRRIALLMRETWLPGDRRFFEGVGQALDRVGLKHESLVLRNLPVDPVALDADLQRLLTSDHRPTGCICRTPLFAEAMMHTVESLGLTTPDDLEIVCDSRETGGRLKLPCVCTQADMRDEVTLAGRMLVELLAGQQPEPLHVILPVELVEPAARPSRQRKPDTRRRRAARV